MRIRIHLSESIYYIVDEEHMETIPVGYAVITPHNTYVSIPTPSEHSIYFVKVGNEYQILPGLFLAVPRRHLHEKSRIILFEKTEEKKKEKITPERWLIDSVYAEN